VSRIDGVDTESVTTKTRDEGATSSTCIGRSPTLWKGIMNDTTYAAVTKRLARWKSREALRHRATKLLCADHGLQRVLDFQPLATTVSLECGCKREVFHRSDDEIVAYESAQQVHGRRKRISGGNNTKEATRVYVEDVEMEEVAA
jgi:hypothetical protein